MSRSFIPAVLLLGACTLAPEPDLQSYAQPGGVAPFKDLGRVDICLAKHRLGPPESGLAGFCVVRNAPEGGACSTRADCATREDCVCGVCTVKFCSRNDECDTDEVCDFAQNRCVATCETDCDCVGANTRCEIGACGQLCLVTAECQTGEICSRSRARCVTVPCGSDLDCFSDEECVIQREPRRLTEPTVVTDEGSNTMTVFFDMEHEPLFERRRHMIFRAVTTGGKRWTVDPVAPVLEPDIFGDYRAPSVVRGTGGMVMYFEFGDGDGIMRAVSSDGRAWTIDPPGPVVVPVEPWEQGRIAAPSAVVGDDGFVRLYYEAGDGQSIGLVAASDAEGRDFPGAGGRVEVLTLTDVDINVLWRGMTRLRSPHVVLDEDFRGDPFYRLYFAARGHESSMANSFGTVEQIPSNYSVGYAASPTGVDFEVYPYNPILDRIAPNSFVNHGSELAPTVVQTENEFLLFYVTADRNLANWENLRVAVNPPPLPEQVTKRRYRDCSSR